MEIDPAEYLVSFNANGTGHLFRRDDVEDAGGKVGQRSGDPVESLCGKYRSYGPFTDDEGTPCVGCLSIARGDR